MAAKFSTWFYVVKNNSGIFGLLSTNQQFALLGRWELTTISGTMGLHPIEYSGLWDLGGSASQEALI